MNAIPHFESMIRHNKEQQSTPLSITSPYHGMAIASVATANAEDVELALQRAYTLFTHRKKWLTVPRRIEIMQQALVLMEQQAEELACLASEEGGKPLLDSRIEMVRCLDSFRLCIDTLRTQSSQAPAMGLNAACQQRIAFMQREPIGVVLAISAFNHPLNLIAHQVGPAIAAGCPVIIKPAAETPLSCIRLVRLLHQAGLPLDWCQWILPESLALAEEMVSDTRLGLFSFIGSAKVGWYLRSKLAPGTRCALEHGGVAAVVMADDANVEQALPSLLKGAFYHAGQVCVSVQRIFAHISIARDLAGQISKHASLLQVGDPLSDQTEVGPLIRANEVDRVHAWVQQAIAAGGQLLCGGKRLAHQCYAPTVLFDPPSDASVSTHEIFGPVVCIYPFEQLDAAIDQANALDMAFQAAVYSSTIDTALYISNRLNASAVMINDHTAFRVDWMPFAGLKHSGLGVGGIPHAIRDMQIEKMTIIRSNAIHI